MHTLKKRLQLIAGIILLVGAIHIVIYLTYQSQKEYRDIIISLSQQQLLATAKSSAKNLEEFIRMQQNVLRSLAPGPILHEIDSQTDYGQLEMRYRELEGEIGGFYIISPQGIVTYRFPHKKRVGKDFSAKPGVAAVLKTQKPYVSELFFSDSGKPCMTVLEPIF